ncbi:MAG: heavy metal translocating P-type ATPase [Desulfocapsaceae bacterium]|nr:heavy metal translocating P-type ATPase [Desulfocapsaceae bacterium]
MASAEQLQVDIKGMHCASCSARIEKVVGNMDGIEQVEVNLATESIRLQYDEEVINYEAIAARVKDLGFELVQRAEPDTSKLELDISGMHCASCSSRIEKIVGEMEGVSSAQVNLASEIGVFEFNRESCSPRDIKEKITTLGFSAKTKSSGIKEYDQREQENLSNLNLMKRRLIAEFIFVIPLFIVSMGEMVGLKLPVIIAPQHNPLYFAMVQLGLTIPIMWFGRSFYIIGIPSLLRRSPNMDSLIAIGTGAAFIYSLWNVYEIYMGVESMARAMDLYFESVGVLITLVSLGKYMENRSKYHTSDAIRQMMDLAPKTAVLLDGDEQKTIEATEIEVGDRLLVKPGWSIPTDGSVVSGESLVDESLMTGESMPVTKKKGDRVYGGTVNSSNTMTIIAEQTGENTMLADIIRMVREAQGSKAPIARIADKVSFYFVPVVMVFALVTGLSWYFLSDVGFSQSLRFFIAVLVIACPCAMGLATPISIMVGTGRGAQVGILVKNGETLEKLEKTTAFVFDKTGTITSGKPEVVYFEHSPGHNGDEILQIAASAEQSSEHSLAEAIVVYAKEKGVQISQPEKFTAFTGKGIEATVAEKTVHIGNRDFCHQYASDLDEFNAKVASFAEEGQTVLYIVIEGRCSGVLAIADIIKPEVYSVIEQLQKLGKEVAMLTGDNRKTARAVAAKAGIERVYAEILPDQKSAIAKEFQDKNHCVAMVGDGINDAPALAQADIGIAMGTGIDIAIESGDVVLMQGNLDGVITAFRLSKAVMKNIRQNLFWAFGYNVLGIPVAAGLLYIFGGPTLSPMIAGAAMALSSVSVVTNALRLRHFN